VAKFFAQHYQPAKLAVAIVGDLSVDRAYRLAQKYFGGWQPASNARPPVPQQSVAPTASSAMFPGSAGPGPSLQGLVSLGSVAIQQGIKGPGKLAEPKLQQFTNTSAASLTSTLDGQATLGTQTASTDDSAVWDRGGMRGTARPSNLAENPSMTMPSVIGPASFVCFYRPATAASVPAVALDAFGDVLSSWKRVRLQLHQLAGIPAELAGIPAAGID
jgi:hypothetical protein